MLKSICAAAAAVVALTSSAIAQDVTLKYSDLDVSRPSGADALDARIAAQARAWCASQPLTTGTILPSDDCIAQVSRTLHDSLPSQVKSAYAAARTSGSTTLAGR